jgi:hypothetical protein
MKSQRAPHTRKAPPTATRGKVRVRKHQRRRPPTMGTRQQQNATYTHTRARPHYCTLGGVWPASTRARAGGAAPFSRTSLFYCRIPAVPYHTMPCHMRHGKRRRYLSSHLFHRWWWWWRCEACSRGARTALPSPPTLATPRTPDPHPCDAVTTTTTTTRRMRRRGRYQPPYLPVPPPWWCRCRCRQLGQLAST